jgi:site-specific DNA-cytosine methylase
MWSAAVNHLVLGDDTPADDKLRFDCLWCCEYNAACQEELLSDASHVHPGHVFANALDCIRSADNTRLGDSAGQDAVRDHILGAPCSSTMWCVKCGKYCKAEQADLHIAGSPCQDFSCLGSRSQINGKRNRPFFSWCRHRLHLREPFVLHENVVSFGLQHLATCLSAEYAVVKRFELCATMFGWASKRRRQFVILVHRSLLRSDIPATFSTKLDTMMALFFRECKYGLLQYAGASESELAEDLA